MDLFRFTTRDAHIDKLSSVKDLEEELRQLRNLVIDKYEPTDLINIVRPFQLYTKCFEKFEAKSNRQLPDFLYRTRGNIATNILERIVNNPITYEEYIDIFKYCKNTKLELPTASRSSNLGVESGLKQIIVLAKIIRDKPNPYTFTYERIYPGNAYIEVCYGDFYKAMFLQILAIRQTICNDITYTVIEDCLNKFNKSYKHPTLVKDTEIMYNAAKEFELLGTK